VTGPRTNTRPAIAGLFFALLIAGPCLAVAQKIPFVALIVQLDRSGAANSVSVEPFREAMRALGYVEGRTLELEIRYSEPSRDPAIAARRVQAIVEDVVGRNVDVIVAGDSDVARAAQKVTKDVPIVMAISAAPEQRGLVKSLARPGGNTTGLSMALPEMAVKRLELFRELLPKATRIAVLSPPVDRRLPSYAQMEATEATARRLGIQLQVFDVDGPNAELERFFDAAVGAKAEGVLTLAGPTLVDQHERIAKLAIKHRLPVIFFERSAIAAGGLMSYGANVSDMYRSAAHYVDRILKGAKPAELPVEEVNTFEFLVNQDTARAIGVTIPYSLLLRANR